MLTRLSNATTARPRRVLLLSALAVLLAALLSGGTVDKLDNGGFDASGTESQAAAQYLRDDLGYEQPNLVLLVEAADHAPVTSPAATEAGTSLVRELTETPGVGDVVSPWTQPQAAATLLSGDSRSALVVARLTGDDNQIRQTAETIATELAPDAGLLRVSVGGESEVKRQIDETTERDLKRAEALAFPLTAVLLLIVFGSALAAGLPLVIGALSVLGTLAALRLLTEVTDVSIYSLNLTTGLGLGLAIDYSLFMAMRYREELERGGPPLEAIRRAVLTAGRTVVFSALTVALCLSALLVFPVTFLRSTAYAGILVVALAAAAALVVLPALLAVTHRWLDRFDVVDAAARLLGRRHTRPPAASAGWRRTVTAVLRRPRTALLLSTGLLLLLGAPFLQAHFALIDEQALPPSASIRQVQDAIGERFPNAGDSSAALVVLRTEQPVDPQQVSAYAAELSTVPGVRRVEAATGTFTAGQPAGALSPPPALGAEGTWLRVLPEAGPYTAATEQVVKAVRAIPAPAAVSVGGPTAQLLDTKDALQDRLPWAIAIVVAATGALLFALTGSILVPIKALATNLLSLTASFGAMVWIFQQGHLQWLVGDFTVTGSIDTTTPVLLFCLAFGLAMDYEILLLSRIIEARKAGADTNEAVIEGISRSARLVTAAALIVAVVFLSFVTSQVAFMKLLGLGLALAVLIDATVVRAVVVPAAMSLAGGANWWAPAPLRSLHRRMQLAHDEAPVADLSQLPVQPDPAATPFPPARTMTGTRP